MSKRVVKKAGRRRSTTKTRVSYKKYTGMTKKALKRLKSASARAELARRARKRKSSVRTRKAPARRASTRRASTRRPARASARRTTRRTTRRAGGKRLNAWQRFLKAHAGRGLSVKRMASLYRKGGKATTSRKSSVGRKRSRSARRNSSALELELDNPGSFLASDPWHPVYEQVLGQFGASEKLLHGLQPVNRRNGKKRRPR